MIEVKKTWRSPKGVIETPNIFIENTNNVLVWNKIGLDIDHPKICSISPYVENHVNEVNDHMHMFVHLKHYIGFKGFQALLNSKLSKFYRNVAFRLAQESSTKVSLLTDVIIKHIHNKLAELFNADKACSVHINHPFRMPDYQYQGKRYFVAKKAKSTIRISDILMMNLIGTNYIDDIIDELLDIAIAYRFVPMLMTKKRRKVKVSYKTLDIHKLLKDVTTKYWIYGHRQTLSMMLTGILYRYFHKNTKLVEEVLDAYIPQNDEERLKRFDPLKYIVNRQTYYGIPSLVSYIKKHLDKNFDIKSYLVASNNNTTNKEIEVEISKKHIKRYQRIPEYLRDELVMHIILAKAFIAFVKHKYEGEITLEFKSFKDLQQQILKYIGVDDKPHMLNLK